MALVTDLQAAQLPPPARRRLIRETAGASLQDIASSLDVSVTTVHRWELGKAKPRRGHAIAYRRLLDALLAVGA